MNRKAISPIVSGVILILIAVSLASIVAPWAYDLVKNVTTNTGNDAIDNIECQNAAYDFVTSYGTYGVQWDFTGTLYSLNTSIKNTGTVSLHNFSIQITHNTTNITKWDMTSATQKTGSNPLKPSETWIFVASITTDLNGTLNDVTVLNNVCPGKSITNDNF
jgi:flagellin-like protein